MFSLLLALWLFRSPKLITGWGDLFTTTKFTGEGKVTVKDASASMLVVFITFALPVSHNVACFLRDTMIIYVFRLADELPLLAVGADARLALHAADPGVGRGERHREEAALGSHHPARRRLRPLKGLSGVRYAFILCKPQSNLYFASNALIFLPCEVRALCPNSGLSEWLSSRLHFLSAWPGIAVSFFISFFTATITEFASNTATANVLVPILVDISNKICLNPIYLCE